MDAIVASIDMLYECRDRLDAYKTESCSVGEHKCDCIKYDVSSLPISIHLPVSRLLAGLYPLCNKFDIDLKQLHSRQKLGPVALIEPSMRCQVMIAQTQASMWRRNGYSLLNQIYFYHNVRCRTEMYDKDITMLQSGAALEDPNNFLIHILNKFGLLNWAKSDYDTVKLNPTDDLIRQIVTLAEECLTILITLLGERYVPGIGEVTHKDSVRREIIHLLCINPMAHSELAKALPEDPRHETGVEDVVHDVAIFKKPSGSGGKGMYELKPECYSQYNPYFYHYSRADQSKSEEAQRKRKKAENEDQGLPPPVPPAFSNVFSTVIHLLDCDVMIHILRLVLSRTCATRSRSWSEMQLEKILHLIGLALHEERRAFDNGDTYFKFIEKTTSGDTNMLETLESLVGHPNVTHEAQKDLLSWVIKNFRSVCLLRNSSFAMDTSTSTVPSGEKDEKIEAEKQRKADMATKRRVRIMAQMSRMQRDFIKENAELFECTSTDLAAAGSDMDISQGLDGGSSLGFPVALGLRRDTSSVSSSQMRETCILCQEEQDITAQDRAMVLAAFIQRSTVLSRERGKVIEKPDEYDPLMMPAPLNVGPHTSTCGHVMHADCWQRFFDNIVSKERRRPFRFRHHYTYDIEKNEFLCPLCETLSNTVIPIVPQISSLIKDSDVKYVELSLNDWLDGIQKTVKSSIQQAKDKDTEDDSFLFVPCPLSTVTKMMADSVAKNFQLLYAYVYVDASTHFSDTITDMLRKFSTDVYAMGLGVHPDDENSRVPILSWSTCAYTIMATEQSLRDEGKPLSGALPSRQADCLAALVRFAAVCNQVIQPDIIKKHCVNMLSASILERSSHHLQVTPCILDIEMFHYLVQLVLSLPVLYAEDDILSPTLSHLPTGGLNDKHATQLVFTAHIVQIMLSADFQAQESMEMEDVDVDDEAVALLNIYSQVKKYAGMEAGPLPSPWQLSQHVRNAALPFLRSSALFFHYLTGVKLADSLQELDPEEFTVLCGYLSLPSKLSWLFGDDQGNIVTSLIKSWCEDSAVKEKLSASSEKLLSYPLSVNQLMTLPDDYSTLINQVSTFTCPKSDGDESRAPTMCLVCGGMLCSQSYCCQTELDGMTVGAATAHAHTCGAGTGMFLRVRECQVLLLNGKTKGCFFAPPYLDDYGETDQGLRRGNPLHLCPDRYRKLQKLWLNHSIPEEIAHCLESNTNLLSIDWQHL
jgi:E3 ubiquitin-protein ligase UBR2